MSALRFVAGIGAGAAIAALVAGATVGAPTAAEPEVTAPARAEPKAAAPATAAAKKAKVERGVLARAAASRRAKLAAGNEHAPNGDKEATGAKDAVIESVEVDWGASQPRP
jgi:hypothetical protein